MKNFILKVIVIGVLNVLTRSMAEESAKSIEDSPFLLKGWFSFFTYVSDEDFDNGQSLPERFEPNPSYFSQMLMSNRTAARDEYGSLEIPSPLDFFFVMTNKAVYVVSARINAIAKTIKSIQLSWVKPFNAAFPQDSGIQDLGKFDEGYCFKIELKTKGNWVICSQSSMQIQTWINKLKENIPKDISSTENITPESTIQMDKIEEDDNKTSKNKTGQWITLQDWSQCTLACGGGRQYLQRGCISPPCEGPPILEKPCNTQPCPTEEELKLNYTTEELPPKVVFMNVTSHKMRYQPCIIKEDVLKMMISTTNNMAKVPVFVVLNNRTMTVFGNEQYDSIIASFDLRYLGYLSEVDDKGLCFGVYDDRDKSKVVGLCMDVHSTSARETFAEAKQRWLDDINFFKEKCQKQSVPTFLESNLLKLKEKQIERERKNEMLQNFESQQEEQKEESINDKIALTAELAMEALERELSYEKLTLKDSLMDKKKQEMSMAEMIEKEKEREDLIEQEIVKKEKIRDTKRSSMEAKKKILDIQRQAMLEVKMARQAIQNKILENQMDIESRKKKAMQIIMDIRARIADKILKEERQGDKSLCNPKEKQTEDREKYCKEKFADEATKLDLCISSEREFCMMCCENEIGTIHLNERNECYDQCETAQEAEAFDEILAGNSPDDFDQGFEGVDGDAKRRRRRFKSSN